MVRRREALEELLGTAGWQYFVQHVVQEWQERGYVVRMGSALLKDTIAPQVVHQTALEILRLLEWPANQVRELKGSVDDE